MSKKKIIDAVQASHPNLTKKQVGDIIDSTFNTIAGQLELKGDKYTQSAFGTFTVKTREARLGVNPQNPTGPKINIGPSASVGFRPATNLKTKVN